MLRPEWQLCHDYLSDRLLLDQWSRRPGRRQESNIFIKLGLLSRQRWLDSQNVPRNLIKSPSLSVEIKPDNYSTMLNKCIFLTPIKSDDEFRLGRMLTTFKPMYTIRTKKLWQKYKRYKIQTFEFISKNCVRFHRPAEPQVVFNIRSPLSPGTRDQPKFWKMITFLISSPLIGVLVWSPAILP